MKLETRAIQTVAPLRKADMHVHLGSIEPTFDDTRPHGPEKMGGAYEKMCRLTTDLFIHPSLAELFGANLPKINKLFIQLQHDPEEMMRLVRERGMDYFAVTDHDSIEPVMRYLNENPDKADQIIVGEEVTTHYRDGIFLHTGVYGINEKQHDEIQKAKGNLRKELLPYLIGEDLLHALNHPFQVVLSAKGKKLTMEHVEELRELFRVVEKRNGLMPQNINERTAELFSGNASIAGSDSHRRRGAGGTFTAAHANTKEEFLEAIKRGNAEIYGEHGTNLVYLLELLDKTLSFADILHFSIPEEASEEIRQRIHEVLKSTNKGIINFEDHLISMVPFQGKWRMYGIMIAFLLTMCAPFYTKELMKKDMQFQLLESENADNFTTEPIEKLETTAIPENIEEAA